MTAPSILAIVPARGGSKGIPRKNCKPLLGKPLVVWSIEQALRSRYITRTFVSTDDTEIAALSEQCGLPVPFLRPAEYARDTSPTYDAVLHALDAFEAAGEHFDIVVLLEPTSPLRKIDDIDRAIGQFLSSGQDADALVSVGEVHLESPYIMKTIDCGLIRPLMPSDARFYQRQQLPAAFFPYGVIYLSRVEALRRTRTFYQERTMAYVIERWQNYEIDDLFDFICVESILHHMLHEVSP